MDFAEHLDALAGEAGGDPARVGHRTQEPVGTCYRPRAVVRYAGATPRNGHYTCWARSVPGPGDPGRDAWVISDDTVVGPPQPTLPPNVDTEAYLVFYEQRPRSAECGGTAADERSGGADHGTRAEVIFVDPDRSDDDEPMGQANMTAEGEVAGSAGGSHVGDDDAESRDDRMDTS